MPATIRVAAGGNIGEYDVRPVELPVTGDQIGSLPNEFDVPD